VIDTRDDDDDDDDGGSYALACALFVTFRTLE